MNSAKEQILDHVKKLIRTAQSNITSKTGQAQIDERELVKLKREHAECIAGRIEVMDNRLEDLENLQKNLKGLQKELTKLEN